MASVTSRSASTRSLYYSDPDGTGPLPPVCDPLKAGRYLCDTIGNRINSQIGYSLVWSTLNNSLRPTNGERVVLSQDFAGLGGDVRYLRTRLSGAKYWNVWRNFIFSVTGEAGYIRGFESTAADVDPVRLNDRFFLGSPQIRGFDIRGVGPRIQRAPYTFDQATDGTITNVQLLTDRASILADDAIGGRAYYLGRAELEIPLGAGVRELGIRPSIYVDVGALWGVRRPQLTDVAPGSPLHTNDCTDANGVVRNIPANGTCLTGETLTRAAITPFREIFVGDTPSPRVSVGFGVNWNSPFGPFRIDIARALIHQPGDDTKLFSFNVGTAF